MTADWLEAVSALADLGLADDAHVSVFGMSMGTRFGLPAAAALGPRLQCAVLGKFGLRQAAPLHPGLRAPGLMTTDKQLIASGEPSPPTTGHGHNRRILAMARTGQLSMPSGQLKNLVTVSRVCGR
jgi:hypothetical protein